jgi:rhodanese-related sulfurtransferase
MSLQSQNINNRGDPSMATKNPQEPFHRIDVTEAKEMLGNGAQIIDVRELHEYTAGHVPGATLIPVNTVFNRREELPKEGKLIFVCAVGQRSALACEMAAAAGFPPEALYNLEGGTDAWVKAGEPVE